MKIKSLRMENYRPYKDLFEIDFAYGDEAHDGKNLTIIVGGNDFGKTTLLNAIAWCIYDEEPYKKSKKQIYNQSAGIDLLKGQKLEVFVEVLMENNEGQDILFRRSQKFTKGNKGKIRKVGDSKFEINNLSDNGKYKIMDYESFRETNLPSGFKQYFLFDGERLLEWLNSDSGSLKKAVEKLSNFDLITKVKNNTQKQLDILADELTELDDTKGQNKQKQISLMKAIDADEEELKKVKKSINSLNESKQELEFFIYRSGGDNAENLKKDIDILNKDVERYRKQLDDLKDQKLNYLISNFYIVLGYPFLTNISSIKDNIKNSQPPIEHEFNISVDDIDFLLEKKECICGNHLVDNDGSVNNLMLFKDKLSQITSKSPEEIELDVLYDKSNELISEFPVDYKEKIQDYLQRITDLEDILFEKEDALSEKEEEFKDLIDANIPEKLKELNRQEKSLTQLNIRKNALETNINNSREELREVEHNILIDQSKEGTISKVESKIEFCEKIIKNCEDLEDKFRKLIHEKLNEVINNEFQSIYNREGDRGKYKQIYIDESLELTIEEIDGIESTSSDSSSGTQLALAVSFITAINLSSGFQLPQIMDTSLGRWDNTLRRNFALTLPEYLEDVQMVFLLLDSEFNDEFEDLISDYIGEKHTITRINDNETILKSDGD